MSKIEKIFLGTGNKNKIREFQEMFQQYDIEILNGYSKSTAEPEETGKDYIENARIKATHSMKLNKGVSIADDSGLSVDYLDGAPGLYSARFGGDDLPHSEKIKLILDLMKDVDEEKRTARFHCAIVLLYPDGREKTFHSTCEGKIAFSPEGNSGFGYDPIFIPDSYNKSFAELDSSIKNGISHRGKSFKKLMDYFNIELNQGIND